MKCNGILLCLYIFFYVSATGQVILNFENTPLTSSYSNNYTYDSDSVKWFYQKAKSSIFSYSSAICLGKYATAHITSDTLLYGVGTISFAYEQAYSTSCEAYVFVNDSCIDTIYTHEKPNNIYTNSSLYYNKPCVISIQQATASSGQLTIDDIKYTHARKPPVNFKIESQSIYDNILTISFSDTVSRIAISTNNKIPLEHTINTDTVLCTVPNHMCGTVQYTITAESIDHKHIDTIISETHSITPCLHDIVITEIMCDPKPANGLAEKEYIELYNRAKCPINLGNLHLIINNKKYSLPEYTLFPEDHMCIYNSDYVPENVSYNHLSVPYIPNLTNKNGSVAIYHDTTLINSLTYSDSWYQHAFKENGGWSLEKINYNDISESYHNWKASENYSGGTPGKINSVFNNSPQFSYPHIVSAYLISDTCLRISFSENTDISYLLDKCNVSNNTISSIQYSENSLQECALYFSEKCMPHTIYTLKYSGIINENNVPVSWNYTFGLYDSLVEKNSVVVSELFFNPENEPCEFIEIYNSSSQIYNLADIYIARTNEFEFSKIQALSHTPHILPPDTYALISTDSSFWKQRSNCAKQAIFSEIDHMPTLPNKKGSLVICNKWGEVIDSVYYSDAMHNPNLLNTKGISLERISLTARATHINNWKSATPGKYSPGCSQNSTPSAYITIHSSISKNPVFTIVSDTIIESIIITVYNKTGILQKKKVLHPHSTYVNTDWKNIKSNIQITHTGIYIIQISCTLQNGKETQKSFPVVEY
ncbi:MAG: lamin tail domain-containing protein [Bacteroidales bacterium]